MMTSDNHPAHFDSVASGHTANDHRDILAQITTCLSDLRDRETALKAEIDECRTKASAFERARDILAKSMEKDRPSRIKAKRADNQISFKRSCAVEDYLTQNGPSTAPKIAAHLEETGLLDGVATPVQAVTHVLITYKNVFTRTARGTWGLVSAA